MFARFGMDLQAENNNKCHVYRVWTPGRRNTELANAFPSEPNVVNDNKSPSVEFGNIDAFDKSAEAYSECAPSLTSDTASPDKMKNTDLSRGLPRDTEFNILNNNSQEKFNEPKDTFSEAGLDSVSMETETNVASSETSIALKPFNSKSNQRHPSLPLTVENARREKWILERLQVSSMNQYFLLGN